MGITLGRVQVSYGMLHPHCVGEGDVEFRKQPQSRPEGAGTSWSGHGAATRGQHEWQNITD